MFQTEHAFTLPMGYLDADGTLHRDGVMRLATAADEILPLKDARVQRNAGYLSVVLLARVVTRLGPIQPVPANVIEGLFAADLVFLQNLYNRINRLDSSEPGTPVTCPKCEHVFEHEDVDLGGSSATPSISSTRR